MISDHPKSTGIPQIDGLSTGPPNLGRHTTCSFKEVISLPNLDNTISLLVTFGNTIKEIYEVKKLMGYLFSIFKTKNLFGKTKRGSFFFCFPNFHFFPYIFKKLFSRIIFKNTNQLGA